MDTWNMSGTNTCCTTITYGRHLTAIDNDGATAPTSCMPAPDAAAAYAGTAFEAFGSHHAAIDNDGATIPIFTVATNTCSLLATGDINGTAVDSERPHSKGTDARLI